jgi:hypothetical protein
LQLQSLGKIGKIVLWTGTTLVLLAIVGAGTATYPSYTLFYYAAGTGLSLIVAGLLIILN